MKQNAIALERKKKKEGKLGDLRLRNEKDVLDTKWWNWYFTRVFLVVVGDWNGIEPKKVIICNPCD